MSEIRTVGEIAREWLSEKADKVIDAYFVTKNRTMMMEEVAKNTPSLRKIPTLLTMPSEEEGGEE